MSEGVTPDLAIVRLTHFVLDNSVKFNERMYLYVSGKPTVPTNVTEAFKSITHNHHNNDSDYCVTAKKVSEIIE